MTFWQKIELFNKFLNKFDSTRYTITQVLVTPRFRFSDCHRISYFFLQKDFRSRMWYIVNLLQTMTLTGKCVKTAEIQFKHHCKPIFNFNL